MTHHPAMLDTRLRQVAASHESSLTLTCCCCGLSSSPARGSEEWGGCCCRRRLCRDAPPLPLKGGNDGADSRSHSLAKRYSGGSSSSSVEPMAVTARPRPGGSESGGPQYGHPARLRVAPASSRLAGGRRQRAADPPPACRQTAALAWQGVPQRLSRV